MEAKFKEYGLNIRESDDPNRQRIDFSIEDETDNVAWVWGDSFSDVDWECNHPHECIEFGDVAEQGECKLCGCFCDWHGVPDEHGNTYPEPHEWYPRRDIGGIIGDYLKELQKRY